jgi:F0F1-type ATP synthase assembly protein I
MIFQEWEMKEDKTKSERTDDLKSAYSWMGVGIEFVIMILFFTYLGRFLDGFQNTSPGFMVMGFLVGFGIELSVILRRAGVIKTKKTKKSD